MSPAKQERSDAEVEIAERGTQPRVISMYQDSLDRAVAPFTASATRRCYIVDPGPPPVYTEIPCDKIIIIDHPTPPTKLA